MKKSYNVRAMKDFSGHSHVYVYPDEALVDTVECIREHTKIHQIDPFSAALLIDSIRKDLIAAAHAQDLDGIM